jgi:hypothetical protein
VSEKAQLRWRFDAAAVLLGLSTQSCLDAAGNAPFVVNEFSGAG